MHDAAIKYKRTYSTTSLLAGGFLNRPRFDRASPRLVASDPRRWFYRSRGVFRQQPF